MGAPTSLAPDAGLRSAESYLALALRTSARVASGSNYFFLYPLGQVGLTPDIFLTIFPLVHVIVVFT